MNLNSVLGVDLGGTKVHSARVVDNHVEKSYKTQVPAMGSEQDVLESIFLTIDEVLNESIIGIGVGVPSVVDTDEGIVYDVQNIPAWKEVHLKKILEDRYNLPVAINNDVNCFALGEKYFGLGSNFKNFVALILGTGIAAGLIINDQLYSGYNCGAGEFGMLPYLDHHIEYYCSGQYFKNVHGLEGDKVYEMAMNGEDLAKSMFLDFGSHLGYAIKAILYTLDPETIIIGGSVSKAYPLFKSTLESSLKDFAYTPVVKRLNIQLSENKDIAVLGAAAVYYDSILLNMN